VGVVGEVKYRGLPDNPTSDPDIYLPFVDRNSQFAFAVRSGESLRLVEQRRGDPEPDPDQLTLDRQLAWHPLAERRGIELVTAVPHEPCHAQLGSIPPSDTSAVPPASPSD